MARDICPRCKVELFSTTDPIGEHLCSDLRKRLTRREKQVQIILSIAPRTSRKNAELIAQKISGILSDED